MCLWYADRKHLNMTNRRHHHYLAIITHMMQWHRLKDDCRENDEWRTLFKKVEEEDRGEEEGKQWETRWKHRVPGDGKRWHVEIEVWSWRMEGWQRREKVCVWGRDQHASPSRGGAAGWGGEMGHETAIMSSTAADTVNTQTLSPKWAPF